MCSHTEITRNRIYYGQELSRWNSTRGRSSWFVTSVRRYHTTSTGRRSGRPRWSFHGKPGTILLYLTLPSLSPTYDRVAPEMEYWTELTLTQPRPRQLTTVNGLVRATSIPRMDGLQFLRKFFVEFQDSPPSISAGQVLHQQTARSGFSVIRSGFNGGPWNELGQCVTCKSGLFCELWPSAIWCRPF